MNRRLAGPGRVTDDEGAAVGRGRGPRMPGDDRRRRSARRPRMTQFSLVPTFGRRARRSGPGRDCELAGKTDSGHPIGRGSNGRSSRVQAEHLEPSAIPLPRTARREAAPRARHRASIPCRPGRGTGAGRCRINSSGDITTCVVPSRQAVFSFSTTCPAALHCARPSVLRRTGGVTAQVPPGKSSASHCTASTAAAS